MNKNIIKIINCAVIFCIFTTQGFGQVAVSYKNSSDKNSKQAIKLDKAFQKAILKEYGQGYVAVSDNTRVVKPALEYDIAKMSPLYISANIIANYQNLSTKEGLDTFNKLAKKDLAAFLQASKTYDKLGEIVFNAVLPKIYHFAVLEGAASYSQISKVYISAYEACVKTANPKCNAERAGFALYFLSYSNNFYKIDYNQVEKFLNNAKVSEDNKIAFLQYAAPVMAQNGAKVHFADIIKSSAAKGEFKPAVTSGYLDPFILVNVIDNSYQWVNSAKTHKDGFWQGAKTKFLSKKPFREYVTPVRPAALNDILELKENAYLYETAYFGTSSYNEPAYLASLVRLYSEFYSDDIYWQDTFKYIFNLPLGNKVMSAHRDIALAKLVLKAPSSVKDIAGLKKFMAAKINNHYFLISSDNQEDIDENLKASLKNELGSVYAELTGYAGKSPLIYTSDEGFRVSITYVDNEKHIQTLLGSMFNFKEKPAEAVANLYIIGLVTKGLAKNGDKIIASLGSLFKSVGRAFNNMPAIISKAKANYKALGYLAKQNNMTKAGYAYRNISYQKAANIAAKNNIITVEGQTAADFFKASNYNAAEHGNILRIGKDVKKAASLGVSHLGQGGTVPSFVSRAEYDGGLLRYSQDYFLQQQVKNSVAQKYKSVSLVKSHAAKAETAVESSIEGARYLLPRKYLRSASKSGFLSLAQNKGYAEGYSFYNKVYQGLGQRGFKFFDIKTGAAFGKNLIFHPQGYLQASGRVGLAFNGVAPAAASPLLEQVYLQQSLVLKQAGNSLGKAVKQIASVGNSIPSISQAAFGGAYTLKAASTAFFNYQPKLLPPAASYMENYTAIGRVPENYGLSTFKITRTDGNSGSGALINYRGLPVILTAGHVVKDEKIVRVSDVFGKETYGTVINKVFNKESDIAAIIVDNPYLKGRQAFALATKEPRNGESLLHHGYPLVSRFDIQFTPSVLKMLNNKFLSPGAKEHSYLTTIGNVTFGSSGGPLSYGYIQDRLVGITTAVTESEDEAVFLALPKIKNFMTATMRKVLFEEPFKTSILPLYPQLSRNYQNILQRYGNTLLSPKTAVEEGLLYPQYGSAASTGDAGLKEVSTQKIYETMANEANVSQNDKTLFKYYQERYADAFTKMTPVRYADEYDELIIDESATEMQMLKEDITSLLATKPSAYLQMGLKDLLTKIEAVLLPPKFKNPLYPGKYYVKDTYWIIRPDVNINAVRSDRVPGGYGTFHLFPGELPIPLTFDEEVEYMARAQKRAKLLEDKLRHSNDIEKQAEGNKMRKDRLTAEEKRRASVSEILNKIRGTDPLQTISSVQDIETLKSVQAKITKDLLSYTDGLFSGSKESGDYYSLLNKNMFPSLSKEERLFADKFQALKKYTFVEKKLNKITADLWWAANNKLIFAVDFNKVYSSFLQTNVGHMFFVDQDIIAAKIKALKLADTDPEFSGIHMGNIFLKRFDADDLGPIMRRFKDYYHVENNIKPVLPAKINFIRKPVAKVIAAPESKVELPAAKMEEAVQVAKPAAEVIVKPSAESSVQLSDNTEKTLPVVQQTTDKQAKPLVTETVVLESKPSVAQENALLPAYEYESLTKEEVLALNKKLANSLLKHSSEALRNMSYSSVNVYNNIMSDITTQEADYIKGGMGEEIKDILEDLRLVANDLGTHVGYEREVLDAGRSYIKFMKEHLPQEFASEFHPEKFIGMSKAYKFRITDFNEKIAVDFKMLLTYGHITYKYNIYENAVYAAPLDEVVPQYVNLVKDIEAKQKIDFQKYSTVLAHLYKIDPSIKILVARYNKPGILQRFKNWLFGKSVKGTKTIDAPKEQPVPAIKEDLAALPKQEPVAEPIKNQEPSVGTIILEKPQETEAAIAPVEIIPAPVRTRRPRIGEKVLEQPQEVKPALDISLRSERSRANFYDWLEEAYASNHIITTNATNSALDILKGKLKDFETLSKEEEIGLNELLDRFSAWKLGYSEDGEIFSRISYVAKNDFDPNNFYLVREGVGLNKKDIPNLPKVDNIKLNYDGDSLRELVIGQKATADDIYKILSVLRENGWEIRLGSHELGFLPYGVNVTDRFLQGNLHVHLENMPKGEDAVLVSYVVDIDLSAIVATKSTGQIKGTYMRLFKNFLSPEARRLLLN